MSFPPERRRGYFLFCLFVSPLHIIATLHPSALPDRGRREGADDAPTLLSTRECGEGGGLDWLVWIGWSGLVGLDWLIWIGWFGLVGLDRLVDGLYKPSSRGGNPTQPTQIGREGEGGAPALIPIISCPRLPRHDDRSRNWEGGQRSREIQRVIRNPYGGVERAMYANTQEAISFEGPKNQ